MSRPNGGGHRHAVFVLVPVAVVLVITLGWFGVRWAGAALFWENPAFDVTYLDIKNGGEVTRDFICGKNGIVQGSNLFAFDIRDVRNEFLSRAPNFKSMEITRQLPGTLRVVVSERVPVARLDEKSRLVADHEGYVFGARGRSGRLPVITGCRGNERLPGARLEAMAMAALQVLDQSNSHPMLGLRVVSVNAERSDHLLVQLADGKVVKLAWPQMGTRSKQCMTRLLEKLTQVVRTLETQEARSSRVLDATFDDGRVFAE